MMETCSGDRDRCSLYRPGCVSYIDGHLRILTFLWEFAKQHASQHFEHLNLADVDTCDRGCVGRPTPDVGPISISMVCSVSPPRVKIAAEDARSAGILSDFG